MDLSRGFSYLIPWDIGIDSENEKLVSFLMAETVDRSDALLGGCVLLGGLRPECRNGELKVKSERQNPFMTPPHALGPDSRPF